MVQNGPNYRKINCPKDCYAIMLLNCLPEPRRGRRCRRRSRRGTAGGRRWQSPLRQHRDRSSWRTSSRPTETDEEPCSGSNCCQISLIQNELPPPLDPGTKSCMTRTRSTTADTRFLLTSARVRTRGVQGIQILHSNTVWCLEIP